MLDHKTIGPYILTVDGRLFRGNKEIKPSYTVSRSRRRYSTLRLSIDGKRKKYFIHRLIAEHFIGPIPEGYVVNHIDHNTHNNSLSNLEIISQKENCQMRTKFYKNMKIVTFGRAQ